MTVEPLNCTFTTNPGLWARCSQRLEVVYHSSENYDCAQKVCGVHFNSNGSLRIILAPVNKPLNTGNIEVCIGMPFSFSSDAVLLEKGYCCFQCYHYTICAMLLVKMEVQSISYVSPSTKLKGKKYNYVSASSISELGKFYSL